MRRPSRTLLVAIVAPGMSLRGARDFECLMVGMWQPLHSCGVRRKSEIIKKGEKKDRNKKERKSEETVKC